MSTWRDVYSLAVRWRQVSEPCDSVVWVDMLRFCANSLYLYILVSLSSVHMFLLRFSFGFLSMLIIPQINTLIAVRGSLQQVLARTLLWCLGKLRLCVITPTLKGMFLSKYIIFDRFVLLLELLLYCILMSL